VKTNWNHENVILQDPVSSALVISAVIGAGSAAHSASSQREAQREAQRRQEEAERKAREEAERIASETKPEEEKATIAFGSGKDTDVGSANDFLTRRTNQGSSGLGASSLTGGLGFS